MLGGNAVFAVHATTSSKPLKLKRREGK